jgi:uncharacterized Zn finger protein
MGYWRDWDDWGYYKPKPRRAAKDGIKAKSQRGQIGETWWSKRFITILESFNIGARLSRGRSYARSGQVMDLKISSGLTTSKVQGSAMTPYKVKIELEPLSDKDWTRVEEAMAGQAIFLAKLLAGEMPREIEDAFTACRLSLFPSSTRDLETDCSCPDWSNPCKHIAATYYILAEKFDEDPFLIFAWRGRTKEQLIERLRALRGSVAAEETSSSELEELISMEAALPLAQCLDSFWECGADFSPLHIQPQAAATPDALLKQLGPAPIEVKGRNLAELLIPAYQAMTAGAERKAFSELLRKDEAAA